MHIEINNGGLLGGASINDFQVDLDQFIGASNDILSAFKTVQNSTQSLNGGVGSLSDALEQIGERIREEERKIEAAAEVRQKTIDFVDLAARVDKQVADLVNQNKEEFYQTNPWLRPPQPVEDNRNFIQKGLDYLGDKFHEAGEALKQVWEDTKEALKKCWDSIVEFYEEHKKIIDTILIVVGAVAAIAAVIGSGGLALVPLLTNLGLSAGAALFISEAVAVCAVVTTASSAVLNVIDTWCSIDNPTFQAWKKGLGIASAVFNFTYNIGTIYNAKHHYKLEDIKNYVKESYTGDPVQYGGRYHDVAAANRNLGYEIHECPAKSAAKIIDGDHRYHTPAVRMSPADHARTASFGHTRESMEYVRMQREFIKNGDFTKAFQMDIKDLEQFGFKYAKGIQEMKKYMKIYVKTRGLR